MGVYFSSAIRAARRRVGAVGRRLAALDPQAELEVDAGDSGEDERRLAVARYQEPAPSPDFLDDSHDVGIHDEDREREAELARSARTESALQASEYQTRQILETAHDAYISIDAEGHITDWNPQACATFGWARHEVLGRPLAEIIIPEAARAAHRTGLARYLETGEGPVIGRLVELEALHRDGRRFPVDCTISPLWTDAGLSFHAFLRDVTQRNHTRSQLADALAKAVESSRMKSEFVANVSHEIRTPLNGVIALSSLLLDTKLTDEQREYVDAVRTSGDALMGVIDDVLDFSKIEAGKLVIDRRPFELRPMVESVAIMLGPAARSQAIRLVTQVDDELAAWCWGDGNRLRQVLTNLTANAVKFTAEGEVAVRVSAERHAGSDPRLRFEVADTGIGIAPESLRRVFDSFTQADGSTTRRYGGTGLGLAISDQLVGLMGGEIGMDSIPSKGSTFWFTVALVEAAAGAVEPWPHPGDGPDPIDVSYVERRQTMPRVSPSRRLELTTTPEGQPDTGRRSVLVAEDNRVNQLVAVRLLERRGFQVDVAQDGNEALELYERGSYALVFMDCQMPELDGYAATAEIRRRGAARGHIPIIAMTANTMEGDRERCLAAGMDDYLTKPVRPRTLDQVIERALGPERREGDAGPSAGASLGEPEPEPEPDPVHAPEDREVLLVDHSVLIDVCGNDSQAVSALAAMFLDQSRGKVGELAPVVAKGESEMIAKLAHGLKGSSASVGALQLAEVAHRLCQAARELRLDEVGGLQAELEETFELTSAALAPR